MLVYAKDIYTSLIIGLCLYIKKESKPGPPLSHNYLFSYWHIVDFFAQCSPVISLKFRIFYSLLTPVLMQPADIVL